MTLSSGDEADADVLGTEQAIQWCIAYLMAEHCRRDASPKAKAAEIFDAAKAFAARADTMGPDGESQEAEKVRRVREIQHQRLDEFHRHTLYALDGLTYPPPPAAPEAP